MKAVYLTANIKKQKAKDIAKKLIRFFASKKIKVYFDTELGKILKQKSARLKAVKPDLYIALGGDGTFLRLARSVYPTTIPVVGINLGSLGFLTEVKISEMGKVLSGIINGKHSIEERIVLEAEFKKKKVIALNDIVVSGISGRVIGLAVYVNNEYINTYKADGIIFSTPTGSTAYSLAAGGPIVNSNVSGIVITPICPHTLTNRPLIVSDDSSVRITASVNGGKARLTADGQQSVLLSGDFSVNIRKTDHNVRLVIPSKNSYYKILREKLRWG